MKLLALSVALLSLAAPKKSGPAPDNPDASLARAHGGRVLPSGSPAPAGGDELRAWLAAHRSEAELERPAKDGPWTVSYVAVFKKPAAKGPVTVKFFDKKDQKNMVEESSSANDAPTMVYHGS